MKKTVTMVFSILCLVTMLALSTTLPALADDSDGQSLELGVDYAYWQFDETPNQIYNLDQVLVLGELGHHTFWAMQFGLGNQVGYVGLQTNGNRLDGSTGDTFIFSIFGATGGSGSCGEFKNTAEGDFWSCRIPVSIKAGETYKYRIWQLSSAPQVCWGAWLITSDGTELYAGQLCVPPADQQSLNYVLNFREYFGPSLLCQEQPDSFATFEPVAANYRNGVYDYYSHGAGVGEGGCYHEGTD